MRRASSSGVKGSGPIDFVLGRGGGMVEATGAIDVPDFLGSGIAATTAGIEPCDCAEVFTTAETSDDVVLASSLIVSAVIEGSVALTACSVGSGAGSRSTAANAGRIVRGRGGSKLADDEGVGTGGIALVDFDEAAAGGRKLADLDDFGSEAGKEDGFDAGSAASGDAAAMVTAAGFASGGGGGVKEADFVV